MRVSKSTRPAVHTHGRVPRSMHIPSAHIPRSAHILVRVHLEVCAHHMEACEHPMHVHAEESTHPKRAQGNSSASNTPLKFRRIYYNFLFSRNVGLDTPITERLRNEIQKRLLPQWL